MYAYLLSGEHPDLPQAEVKALVKSKVHRADNILFAEGDCDFSRLAYTRKVFKVLFESTEKTLSSDIYNFNWQSVYKKNFSVRVHGLKMSEKDLAGLIWYNLEKPRVNLKNPKTQIEFLQHKERILAWLLVHESSEDFQSRRAHLRPALSPTSLHPKLARALVNLTGITEGTIVDPFSGTAGILIEAGRMGFRTIGYDTDLLVQKKAKKNLDFFKIKNYTLEKQDALQLKEKHDYIVTDLPYGRNTRADDKLYSKFLKTLKKILGEKAVVVLPDSVNSKKKIHEAKLTIENEFDYYIHKSLSKKIYVLS